MKYPRCKNCGAAITQYRWPGSFWYAARKSTRWSWQKCAPRNSALYADAPLHEPESNLARLVNGRD